MPLPLAAKLVPVEFIRVLRCFAPVRAADPRLTKLHNRFAGTVAIDVGAENRKAVSPCCRFEVNDPAVRALVLKVYKPPLARRRVDKSSLVWAVYRGLSLSEDNLMLIRTKDIL